MKIVIILLVLLTGCTDSTVKTSANGLQYKVVCIEGYKIIRNGTGLAGPIESCLIHNYGGKK